MSKLIEQISVMAIFDHHNVIQEELDDTMGVEIKNDD